MESMYFRLVHQEVQAFEMRNAACLMEERFSSMVRKRGGFRMSEVTKRNFEIYDGDFGEKAPQNITLKYREAFAVLHLVHVVYNVDEVS